ncbi:efflux RND transporter periplasmic adaptor subunit [Neotabrizicola shimadae]|uniref:Efflux RND transporter periplasmic adaptor subunit n=1 Tax=Neotabrizicola shimadae TaxID=2807096 RepID=A0A8G1ED95_9RHOB|nr:efflux RND transporter periplasmic adaptor subunit [Neotabrizicola shimadae]QYZ71292.1 efflux RND transporter periplasmic adaptor subunit [Neotabrizicola shimadae]
MRPASHARAAVFGLALTAASILPAFAEPLAPIPVTEWKAVYGRIEARDRIPARARLGGTLVSVSVVEGDTVTEGQVIAEVVDEKLGFQLKATDGQLDALQAQLENAKSELARGEELLSRGVATAQRLDALRAQVDALTGQIEATRAQRRVIEQQAAEGSVLSPVAGRVLDVPVAAGAVIMPGEPVAEIGGGGVFLRLAVPERHATALKEGDTIEIEEAAGKREGKLARIYPLIENGRVVADVEVQNLPEGFFDARVLVRLPVGQRLALMVPAEAIHTQSGLDFVAVRSGDKTVMRAVVPGQHQEVDGRAMVEIISGLAAGDDVLEGANHE